MDKAIVKRKARIRRHQRVRKTIFGTANRPRLNVFKSNVGIYAQLVDDERSVTLSSASTLDKELKSKLKVGANKEAATKVGELIAARAKELKVTEVVFDRGGNLYHGRVRALAEAARAGGLKF